MIDPSIPLADFQRALNQGEIALLPCPFDRTLWVYYDRPLDGRYRMTYVRLNNREVTAFVMVAQADPYEGLPCFSVGYATPEAYRGRGHAKEILRAAIAEVKHAAADFGATAFYMDACVGIKNVASQRVAASVFGNTGFPCTDHLSGAPSLQYFLKVTTD